MRILQQITHSMSGKNYSVLIVDDEPSIHEFLSYNLIKAGFTVYSAINGIEGIKVAIEEIPDLILMDVMMPELDGIMACIEIRKEQSLSETKIVILSARSEDYSQIAGYEAGCDCYLTKPISPKLLITKINSILSCRRNEIKDVLPEIAQENRIIERGKLSINLDKYIITVDSREIELPRKEFELLVMLAKRPEKVFSRAEIYDKIWGLDSESGSRTIDVHIRKIREKIGEDYIKTQKGVGYRFIDLTLN